MASLKVITNRDGTITVRVGKAVEHISTDGKEKGVLFDQIKYAAMSKGASLADASVAAVIWETRN